MNNVDFHDLSIDNGIQFRDFGRKGQADRPCLKRVSFFEKLASGNDNYSRFLKSSTVKS